MAQKRLNTQRIGKSSLLLADNNDVNWKSGCVRMENGNERKKKEKKKEEILVGGQERRNDGKRNLFSSEETPSGFREKEIAPG